jgi:hypothetical protein
VVNIDEIRGEVDLDEVLVATRPQRAAGRVMPRRSYDSRGRRPRLDPRHDWSWLKEELRPKRYQAPGSTPPPDPRYRPCPTERKEP